MQEQKALLALCPWVVAAREPRHSVPKALSPVRGGSAGSQVVMSEKARARVAALHCQKCHLYNEMDK